MKNLKYASLIIAIIAFVLAIIARFAAPATHALFGLAALTYFRMAGIMLLFTLVFHFLFSAKQ